MVLVEDEVDDAAERAAVLADDVAARGGTILLVGTKKQAKDAIKEVAEATGWSESKVKVRAFRARKKIREAMEKLLSYKGANAEQVLK